ncbi:MAG: hypothetical protein GXO77_07245 [Calditrichaeota bacterium]|nr:hypothetical protein [Calditrichota bacterium]
MKRILRRHLSSALVVSIILGVVFIATRPEPEQSAPIPESVRLLQELDLNTRDAFQKQLYLDMAFALTGDSAKYKQLWQKLVLAEAQQAGLTKSQLRQKMANRRSVPALFLMYVKFILIYLVVMALTYYGVQTLGTYLFLRYKQQNPPDAYRFLFALRRLISEPEWQTAKRLGAIGFKILCKAMLYLLLFTPAYVIAYSIKTDFDTESVPFMILLGVISNGVLITYSNKFYHFLLNESRKGYVRTAIVKNLNNDYSIGRKRGIRWRSLLALKKKFPGHVLEHIFMNARFQYFATLKEQAAFIITGLLIIEMALNIHGHLSYELLQQLLYQNYDLAALIILGIFLIVKATELITDLAIFKEQKRLGSS